MTGTYEVFIEVRHGPKHTDHNNEMRFADKLVDTGNPIRMVHDALMNFADSIDLDTVCGRCGEVKEKHFEDGDGHYCYNRYGPHFQVVDCAREASDE